MDKNSNPGLKRLTEALKARLYYVETNGGEYNPKNAPGSATGKYQFIWDKQKNWDGWGSKIKSWAKSEKVGYGNISREDFLANGKMQEEFFEQVYMPQVYDFVQKQMPNNVRNLAPDEIAQLYHLNPDKAKAYIAGGEFEKDELNPTGKIYLEKGAESISRLKSEVKDFDVPELTKSIFFKPEEKAKKVNEYFDEFNKINSLDINEGAKNLKLKELKNQYGQLGLAEEINNKSKINDELEFKKELLFKEFYAETKNSLKAKASGGKPYHLITLETEKQKKLADEISKIDPDFAKAIHKPSSGNYTATLGLKTSNDISNYYLENAKKYTGNNDLSLKDIVKDEKYEIDNPLALLVGGSTQLLPKSIRKVSFENKNDTFNDLEFKEKKVSNATILNTDIVKQEKNYDPISKDEGTKTTTETPAETPAEESKENLAKSTEEAKDEKHSQLLNYLDKQYLDVPDNMTYNKKDFKPELPFEAIANAFVGVAGIEQANTDVPLRTEQVSQGVLDYASKLAKIAQMGLPPEKEAELMDANASAYSSMMNSIVESSAGNRNLVLGNQGQLDYNRIKANQDISIADFQAKQQALAQYGEVMTYINEFDSRRDIDNTRLKQSIAFDRRQDGRDLAFAGFSSMTESLQNAAEYGPGSANHMLMSQIRQKAFGYDPDMKDDGTGTKKGTQSWYLQNVVEPIKRNNQNVDFLKENIPYMDEGQNKFFNLVAAKTGKTEDLVKAVEFAKSTDVSKVNEQNIDKAVQSGNYGQMLYNEVNDKSYLADKDKNQYETKYFS